MTALPQPHSWLQRLSARKRASEFCAVRFERGMGFGNRLYPWARCHLYSLHTGVPMLAPHWWWPPRVRPLLKAPPPAVEVAGHLYVRGMRQLPEYIGGLRRALLLATSRNQIRVFRGEGGRFSDLTAEHDVLHAALRRMSTTAPPSVAQPYIAAHVRRGDFGKATPEELWRGGGLRTPTAWFVAALRVLRARVGTSVPIIVVSDGSAAELVELLQQPNVQLVRTGAPLGDLLVLAGARVLLASGSSFSAWAAYLGGMSAATHPGQSLAWFGLQPRAFLGEYEPDADGNLFIEAAVQALSP